MFETYRIMSSRLKPQLQEKELEELCDMYEKETDPRKRNDIYRTLYCKLFPMMLSVQKNYPMLTNAQRVEVTMMILISTLRCYGKQKGAKSKFSTYYCTNLKNGMMTQINSLHCNKRCAWLNVIEDETQNDFILSSISNKSHELSSDYFLENLKHTNNLSGIEKEYIECALKGYRNLEDFKKQLNIKNRVNDFNAKKGNVTNPMTDKEELNFIKKIKKSIKSKFLEFDRQLFY